jgi:hypothetical protein
MQGNRTRSNTALPGYLLVPQTAERLLFEHKGYLTTVRELPKTHCMRKTILENR